MSTATDKQMDFILGLMDRIKRRDQTDSAAYQAIQRAIGRRSVAALSTTDASKVIEALLEELQ